MKLQGPPRRPLDAARAAPQQAASQPALRSQALRRLQFLRGVVNRTGFREEFLAIGGCFQYHGNVARKIGLTLLDAKAMVKSYEVRRMSSRNRSPERATTRGLSRFKGETNP